MAEWIDVRNFDELMTGYQKSSSSSKWMPGLAAAKFGEWQRQLSE